MKILFTLILSLLTLQVIAFETPQMETPHDEDRAPRGEVLMYNGVEYVKRYKYIIHLNGYAATIQRATDANRIDSIYKVITREANNRMIIDGNNYVSAVGLVQNDTEVKLIAKRVLGSKWIKELNRRGSNVRVNIVANPQEEVLYLDISYISEDVGLDWKMIELQEKLEKRVKFAIKGSMYNMSEQSDEYSEDKISLQKHRGYEYYYLFWVTSLSMDSGKMYVSRGLSIVD